MLSLKLKDRLEQVAKESARMSWPGQMQSILREGTKDTVERYFSDPDQFIPHLCSIWSTPSRISEKGYDDWHGKRVKDIGNLLKRGNRIKTCGRTKVPTNYNPEAVACKLLNTFMHQLMKYQECRYLWKDIHLVLDKGVYKKLYDLTDCYHSLEPITQTLQFNPYKITYADYMTVQNQLWKFIAELNSRPCAEYMISSRIELNPILWT